ncbi:MAG: polyphosphate kinase 1 [Candidatus Kapaibacterium sp.]
MARNNDNNNINLKDPKYYFNRELSLLDFNERVLQEAADKNNPLLERLKFVIILSSNLDEFFMIRVAGLKGQISAGVAELSYDGQTPKQQMIKIRRKLEPIYKKQEKIVLEEIFPELEKHDIKILEYRNLGKEDQAYLKEYFMERILSVLTPLSLGPANPFPRLINRSLNVAFVLKDHLKKAAEQKVAFVQVPGVLPRLIELKRKTGHHFVRIEQLIKAFAEILFPGLEIETANTFRVTRDADIEIAEDEAEDLLFEIAEQIKQRRWGRAAVRLEVSSRMPDYLVNLLMNSLDLEPIDVYVHNRPINLQDFMQLTGVEARELKYIPFVTRSLPAFQREDMNVFDAISQHDHLVHHPFDSFTNSTLKYIDEASIDPDVLAIKITLYRTGMNSPIVKSLIRAAENGKFVTAFVELKARFDEEKNIIWAKELENAGVHVVYGVIGLKTHCKIAIVVRSENERLRTYLHLSTGNYNQATSRLYTDIGFFTANEKFGRDATNLFNFLTGHSYPKDWNHFIVAPLTLRQSILAMIKREAEKHTKDNPGLIIAKMNSLAHREVIPALYEASMKGVEIRLLVRGISCLKPGVPKVSENIRIKSVIGRFLEHSRIFYFKNGGDEEYYLSSADWMSRNLHKRVELMFPVIEKNARKKISEILDIYWRDNTKSWQLESSGEYIKLTPAEGEEAINAQDYFLIKTKEQRESNILMA